MNRGFTFLEVLVALAVLTLLATAIMECHVGILRAQTDARTVDELRLVTAEIAGESWAGTPAADAAGKETGDWDIDLDTFQAEAGTNSVTWNRWVISPSNRPSMEAVLCLRTISNNEKKKALNILNSGGLGNFLKGGGLSAGSK